SKQGSPGGFPTYHDHNYGVGSFYGTILFNQGSAEYKEIPANELGEIESSEDRMRAVNLWAALHHYVGGFPTFHEATKNGAKVYGAVLLKDDVAEFRDVSSNALANEQFMFQRMRGAHDWATQNHQYLSGFPTMHPKDGGPVVGTILIKGNSGAVYEDIP